MGNNFVKNESLKESLSQKNSIVIIRNKLQRAKPINEEIGKTTSLEIDASQFSLTSNKLDEILATKNSNGIKLKNFDGSSYINLERVISISEIDCSYDSGGSFSSFFSTSKKSEISSIKKIKNKSSLFKDLHSKEDIPKRNLFEKNFDEIFRKKLLETIQLESFPDSKLIHLDELMIPFPEENELDNIENPEYLYDRIDEIKKKVEGKYLLNKSHVDITSKESVIEYMSNKEFENDNENNQVSFYTDENCYIGINFKIIDDHTYVIYFLYAVECQF